MSIEADYDLQQDNQDIDLGLSLPADYQALEEQDSDEPLRKSKRTQNRRRSSSRSTNRPGCGIAGRRRKRFAW